MLQAGSLCSPEFSSRVIPQQPGNPRSLAEIEIPNAACVIAAWLKSQKKA
jgi:hypothetical protein